MSSSWQPDDAAVGRKEQAKFRLVGQEEFQSEQDRDQGTGRITPGEFGQQRHGAAKVRWLVDGKPKIDAAQIAGLTGPASLDAWDGLPNKTQMVDVEWHDREGSARVKPAGFFGGGRTWGRAAEVQRNQKARDRD